MKRLTIIILLAAAAGMVSCSAVRHCQAPDVDLPERIAGEDSDSLTVADVQWWRFYGDSTLCQIIERTLDNNRDMLAAAAAKTGPGIPPVFLHQSMPQLDLYGTVDAAICCLDSLNYLTNPRDVQRTFERLHLFIAPGGTLIFDVNTPEKFLRLDGQVYLDETEDAYCVWRTEFSRGICSYYVDLFNLRPDGAWERGFEYHRQRCYTAEELTAWYQKSGLPLKKFFNTSGLKYKELNLKDKVKTTPEDQLLALLASDGKLVKRPVLVLSDRVLVGFKEEEWAKTLL